MIYIKFKPNIYVSTQLFTLVQLNQFKNTTLMKPVYVYVYTRPATAHFSSSKWKWLMWILYNHSREGLEFPWPLSSTQLSFKVTVAKWFSVLVAIVQGCSSFSLCICLSFLGPFEITCGEPVSLRWRKGVKCKSYSTPHCYMQNVNMWFVVTAILV